MAEQSYIFDFSRTDTFFENFNVGFFLDEMWQVTGRNSDGTYQYKETVSPCFELVTIQYGADNINEYLDEYGCLNESNVEGLDTADCSLDYYNRGDGEATIELHGTVSFNIGDTNIPMKAIILRSKTTGYVLGYSINMTPFSLTDELIFDDNCIFWDISRFNNGG